MERDNAMMNVKNYLKNVNPKRKSSRLLSNYLIATCITLTVFLFLFSLHASGQESKNRQLRESEILVTEQHCRTELREQLNSMGYQNAGITITHISEDESNTSYHIELHHKKLSNLSDESTNDLLCILMNQYSVLLGDDLQIYVR